MEKWQSLGPLSVEKIRQAAPDYPVKVDAGVVKKWQTATNDEFEGQAPAAGLEEANGIARVIAADGTLREGQFEKGVPHGYIVEI